MAKPSPQHEITRSVSPGDSGNEENEEPHEADLNVEQKPQNGSKSANSKDPSRPRRKKARRACYACQRAHLTCGDERPCQRCIKRGLQDACQDGVRKKAKYLHDAPNEALLPGAASHYSQAELKRTTSNTTTESAPHPPFFQPSQPFNAFDQTAQMPPPALHERSMSTTSYSQPSPSASNFNIGARPPLQSPTAPQDRPSSAISNSQWPNITFDQPDPLISFDIASMNFGNHYGALEFGMLGHMATGAGETPDSESGTQRGSVSQFPLPLGSFSEGSSNQYGYGGDVMMGGGDWANGATVYPQVRKDPPHAFAIESNAHLTSPETTNTPPNDVKFEDSPLMNNTAKNTSARYAELPAAPDAQPRAPAISTPQLKARSQLPAKSLKRARDPSSIYTSVTVPYAYTSGFHQLIAYLQRRFSNAPSKTLAIAKSLASIRPSFIATNKTLNREDLIFMEKCFQRTLWEYEGFIEGVGTPTIVARRTGEIAAVGKEFQILTGWTKNVLLGRAPNLNVNRGHSGKTPAESGANSNGKVTGSNTPSIRPEQDPEPRQQPVFLAELLDDETVVQFYEDFARLAFGDSRGSIKGKGKLLKYRTKDDEIDANLKAEAVARGESSDRPEIKRIDSFAQARPQDAKKGISGEKGMQKLGSSDGKVDCAYCWTVKRDVFEVPMLIVMNVSLNDHVSFYD